MADMWKADEDVMVIIRDLIAKYHPHLALVDDEIAVVFKEKATTVGTVEIIGKTGKAPAILSVLGDTKWKFLITLAADAWVNLDDKQKVALLDHHLCGCRVEENEQNGALKCFVAPPDVSFFKGEIERHGVWRTSGTPPSANLIQELFGV
jgi:hypothetical protein